MKRLPNFLLTIASVFVLSMVFAGDLLAFSINETRIFSTGPYAFKMEISINGTGSLKKRPLKMTSLKVKMKNDRASSEILRVKTIRAFTVEKVYQDIETQGFTISPAQWVTKYYRLRKEKQPTFSERGYIEIAFENFTIQFNPRERKFQGPIK